MLLQTILFLFQVYYLFLQHICFFFMTLIFSLIEFFSVVDFFYIIYVWKVPFSKRKKLYQRDFFHYQGYKWTGGRLKDEPVKRTKNKFNEVASWKSKYLKLERSQKETKNAGSTTLLVSMQIYLRLIKCFDKKSLLNSEGSFSYLDHSWAELFIKWKKENYSWKGYVL